MDAIRNILSRKNIAESVNEKDKNAVDRIVEKMSDKKVRVSNHRIISI